MIIGFILGCIIISIIFFFVFYPKVKEKIEINQDILKKNQQLQEDFSNKNHEYQLLLKDYDNKADQRDNLEKQISNSIQKLSELDDQAKDAAVNFKKAYFEKVESDIKLKEKEATIDYQNYKSFIQKEKEKAEQEYLNLLKDSAEEFSKKLAAFSLESDQAKKKLAELHSKVDAAVAADKRKFEEENKIDYYRLIIPEEDLKEIAKIREIIPYLRNPEPLNKVIYKYYYEKPYNDLIGRVLGSKSYTGIYKITNLTNGMCYVGQAVSISERWRQHIKRGLGAETPTNNKLYPAMQKFGVENFSFEMIEECERSKLNEREDYWQEFFKAKEFGYSIK